MTDRELTTGAADFRAEGLCAQTDPEAFYPEPREPAAPAIAVCHRCPVRVECLEYALTHDERFGVWGGRSARERARLRRDRALPSRAERARAEQRDAARRLHGQGRIQADIARDLGISETAVRRYLTDSAADQPAAAAGDEADVSLQRADEALRDANDAVRESGAALAADQDAAAERARRGQLALWSADDTAGHAAVYEVGA